MKCYTAQKSPKNLSALQLTAGERNRFGHRTDPTTHTHPHTHDVWQEKAKRNISLSAITHRLPIHFPFSATTLLQFYNFIEDQWSQKTFKNQSRSTPLELGRNFTCSEDEGRIKNVLLLLKTSMQTLIYYTHFYTTTLQKRYCALNAVQFFYYYYYYNLA